MEGDHESRVHQDGSAKAGSDGPERGFAMVRVEQRSDALSGLLRDHGGIMREPLPSVPCIRPRSHRVGFRK